MNYSKRRLGKKREAFPPTILCFADKQKETLGAHGDRVKKEENGRRHEDEGKTEKEEERKRESTVKKRSDEMENEARRALEKSTWRKGRRRRLRGVFLIVFESERVPTPRDDQRSFKECIR